MLNSKHPARGARAHRRLASIVMVAVLSLTIIAVVGDVRGAREEDAERAAAEAPAPVVHHVIEAVVDPAAHTLRAVDRFETAMTGFWLHDQLEIEALTVGGEPVERVDPAPDPDTGAPSGGGNDTSAEPDGERPWRYVTFTAAGDGPWPVEVRYGGTIADQLAAPGQEYSRSFETTTGLIDTIGVYLSGATAWVPTHPGRRVTFELAVELPDGYRSMSQGELAESELAEGSGAPEVWSCDRPQEEIYLVAGRYVVTEREHGGVRMQTYLYADDPELSDRYLEATANYLDLYSELLGPYPYGKFALVENFWQSGYGMPSLHAARRSGHPHAVDHRHVLRSRDPAQLVRQRRLRRLGAAATGARG